MIRILCLLFVLLASVQVANSHIYIHMDTSLVESSKQHDLFYKADSIDKGIASGKIKYHKLPQVLPNTGYDPSVGQSPIEDMPTRNKYDKGRMEGQDIKQYRKDMEAIDNEGQAKVILLVVIVLIIISVVWTLIPNKEIPTKEKDID